MDISTKLMAEHQLILSYIATLENLLHLANVENQTHLINKHGQDFIRFIQKYADGYHHAKEEDVLFEELTTDVLTHCNPIPQMLHEHDIGRECVAGMIQTLEQGDHKNFKVYALDYCNLLKSHIYKEDQILYPMAERDLDEEAKQRINQAYNLIELKYETPLFDREFETLLTQIQHSLKN